MPKITLGLIQKSCSDNPQKNISNHLNSIKEAASKGAQIILLQELFSTRYFPQRIDDTNFNLAESIPGPLTNRLCKAAKKWEVVMVAPFFERRASGMYHNSLVVIDADGSLMGTYRKTHLPDDPGFHEKYYFTPGDNNYPVFDTKYAKIAPLICWDQWFPEPARIAALKGADIMVYPSAIGTLAEETDAERAIFLNAWQTIQQSHAIANGCFVASINRVGQEGDITFWGHSFIAAPFGQMLAEAGTKEEVLIQQIDLTKIEKQRQTWPFFRDRRVDTYGSIMNRFIDS